MRRPIYSVLIGVVLAAAALWFVYSNRSEPVQAAPIVIETTPVLVAKTDIAFGDKIVPDLVRTVQWPSDAAPDGAINSRPELLEGPDAPRIALRSFAAGEPFLKAKVSGFGEKPVLSRKVADGMRAFTVRINDVSGVAGFILPGDRVDIMLTRDTGERGRGALVTDVVLQNIAVLGIDQLASEEVDDPVVAKSATFEVTPEQAQKLALASQVGTLSLTLRNFTNLEENEARRISVADLGAKPAPARRQDDGAYVRVRKGTEVHRERVPQ